MSKEEVVSMFSSYPAFDLNTTPLSWGGQSKHAAKQPAMTQEEHDEEINGLKYRPGVYMWQVPTSIFFGIAPYKLSEADGGGGGGGGGGEESEFKFMCDIACPAEHRVQEETFKPTKVCTLVVREVRTTNRKGGDARNVHY